MGSPHLLKAILARPDPVQHLAVDELGTDGVLLGVMPGREELLPEVDAPGCLALILAPRPGQLLTLGDCIHHMVAPAAQGPELRPESGAAGVSDCCVLDSTGTPTLRMHGWKGVLSRSSASLTAFPT